MGGRFYSIPCRARYLAAVDLEEKVEFILFIILCVDIQYASMLYSLNKPVKIIIIIAAKRNLFIICTVVFRVKDIISLGFQGLQMIYCK